MKSGSWAEPWSGSARSPLSDFFASPLGPKQSLSLVSLAGRQVLTLLYVSYFYTLTEEETKKQVKSNTNIDGSKFA